ncbi:MAG: tyrosine-type recombinase/integrase [Minicystis sp.]
MSVRVVPWSKRGKSGFEIDIRITWPEGGRYRARLKSPVSGHEASKRWGLAREKEIIRNGKAAVESEAKETAPKRAAPSNDVRPAATREAVPTLAEFWPRWIEGYAEANRQKPSGIDAKKRILRLHLVPFLGSKRLDEIRAEDVQGIKSRLAKKSAKTVNNVLCVLGKMLRVAVEWEVIPALPCRVTLLKTAKTEKSFLEFDDLERLVEGAKKVGWAAHLMVLIGAEAGLRRGEMISLRWTDIDLVRGVVHIRRADWNGIESLPKGGRGRSVELTMRLMAALKEHRHLRSERVLCEDDGKPIKGRTIARWMRQSTRRAGLAVAEGPHILRHTFCSHLAMRGAPVMAIKELAGHRDISTTMGYMHLSPTAKRNAISLLDTRANVTTIEGSVGHR